MGITKVEKLAKFECYELATNTILGRGSFYTIKEISSIKLSISDPIIDRSRSHIANSCHFDDIPRYVVKMPRRDLDEESLTRGAHCLALEAKILANLDHPHIINLRAVASADSLSTGYFLILDRLHNTLETQCNIWAVKMRVLNGIGKLVTFKKRTKRHLMLERLTVAHNIAMALDHMHCQRIMHRNLTPQNIGFDIEGEVKLFDFGLAKVLSPSNELEDGNYRLTGFTGSLHYMAPEVARCQPYSFSADVFSFGLLLWRIMSCDIPFQKFSVQMHKNHVVENGYRPKIKKSWAKDIKKVIEICWSADSRERPNISDILPTMKKSIMELDLGKSLGSNYGQ